MFILPGPSLQASERGALAWADRLYHQAAPLPQDVPEFAIKAGLSAYRQVEHRYGSSLRTRVGIGNCLMLMGRYGEATKAYPPGLQAEDARHRAILADELKPLIGNRAVVQIEPVPSLRGRWIALLARLNVTPASQDTLGWATHAGLVFLSETETGVRPIGREMPVRSGSDGYFANDCRHRYLFLTHLSQEGSPCAVLSSGYVAADCAPTDHVLYRIGRNGLRKLKRFESLADVRFVSPTRKSGLRVFVSPTWKVWWPDVYEWRGSRFTFANRRSGDLYDLAVWSAPSSSMRKDYPLWLKRASTLAIRARYLEALTALRQAERACRMAVWYGQHNSGNGYYTAGFHGDDRVNLAEIRQRIAWLSRGELDHALLYRPYDWNLQVPPYRLGRARTVQERRGDF